ncbi:dihydrofolate reductase family protein [Alkalicoccus daliensis]|uniref:Dihydrofolate reductase n=1 Tax=Alkalicoccus daliensis TaxID=745820 RepID=A0A1G9ZBS4_9BACI|nr:dihydrofolate reductase family protein [Alkalicoccus daliensis]SDN18890.1 Dihydrofolate reductase [Alkalicoccus daliensis]
MRAKVLGFIAASLDGYIATKEHSLAWLFRNEGKEDNGYEEFYKTVDKVVMGRKTYEWIIGEMKDNFPYKDKDCYVFTSQYPAPAENVTFIQESPPVFIRSLLQQEGNIWVVGGGSILKPLLENRLIDEIEISITPVLIGEGIRLFQEGNYEEDLELINIRKFDDFVSLKYRFKHESTG